MAIAFQQKKRIERQNEQSSSTASEENSSSAAGWTVAGLLIGYPPEDPLIMSKARAFGLALSLFVSLLLVFLSFCSVAPLLHLFTLFSYHGTAPRGSHQWNAQSDAFSNLVAERAPHLQNLRMRAYGPHVDDTLGRVTSGGTRSIRHVPSCGCH